MLGFAALSEEPLSSFGEVVALSLETTAPNLSFSGSTAQLETKVRDELAATAPNLSLSGSTAELYTKLRDELAANGPNLALSGSTAQLTTTAGLELLATAPNLALSGSTAQLETKVRAVLEATAPSLSLSGSTAQIVTAGALELSASAPGLALSGSTAQLVTVSGLELNASAANLALSGSTGQLVTDAEILLEASAPSLSLSGSSAQLFTGTRLTLESTAPSLALSGSNASLETDLELVLVSTAPNLALSGSSAVLILGQSMVDYGFRIRLYQAAEITDQPSILANQSDLHVHVFEPDITVSGGFTDSDGWMYIASPDFATLGETVRVAVTNSDGSMAAGGEVIIEDMRDYPGAYGLTVVSVDIPDAVQDSSDIGIRIPVMANPTRPGLDPVLIASASQLFVHIVEHDMTLANQTTDANGILEIRSSDFSVGQSLTVYVETPDRALKTIGVAIVEDLAA